MKRLALLLGLLIPVSVASAEPNRPVRHERYADGHSYNEGYYDRGGKRVDRDRGREKDRGRGRWAPIAQQYSATSERQFINVLGKGGRFNRLLVEGVRGAPVIEKVAVEFEDRQTQVWDVNRRLPRGADEMIDLGGHRRIHRIVVYTNPQYRGAYSIYGT